jgi:hypothetical protein
VLGLYVVIFDPCSAKPAISPFCPKGTATTLCDNVVLSTEAPAPLSITTTLGSEPIAQPSLLSRNYKA